MATRLLVFTVNPYTVKGSNEVKNRWTRIGAAFENNDGSINIKLDALPVNGEIHVREEDDEDRRRREEHRNNNDRDQRDQRRNDADNRRGSR